MPFMRVDDNKKYVHFKRATWHIGYVLCTIHREIKGAIAWLVSHVKMSVRRAIQQGLTLSKRKDDQLWEEKGIC